MHDIGLSHIALPVSDLDKSVAFYEKYAAMKQVHYRLDEESGWRVSWVSDGTRPFVIVLIEGPPNTTPLAPMAHLGVGCKSREIVDSLCEQARAEGCLIGGPSDYGPPVGYWAFLRDPDGHTLELSFGQEVALTVEENS